MRINQFNELTPYQKGHSVLHDKLRGEIAWQSIVRRRLIKQVNVSNEEIEDEFRRLQSIQHLPKYKVSEIFLAVDNPDQEDQVLDVARRLLGQLDEGAKFNLIAREFSLCTKLRIYIHKKFVLCIKK